MLIPEITEVIDYFKESLLVHRKLRGKIEIRSKMTAKTKKDLSLAYSPGVAAPCEAIRDNPDEIYNMTFKGNAVAIVSDGSAVLGLGNIGGAAALPVMEGKAMLFKEFAGIDGIPIVLSTQDTQAIIDTVRAIAPTFGGINLEDIAAPQCFEIEEALQDLGIPVFHDDQHGTAIVVYSGIINASKLIGKKIKDLKVVMNGAGAAGVAIAKMLKGIGFEDVSNFEAVKEIVMCDRIGILSKNRTKLNSSKVALLSFTNPNQMDGSIFDALVGADVFIGVSEGNLLQKEHIATMAKDPIIFALANPIPEIMPSEAYKGGAAIMATGRSDMPNQVNNVLGYPGIFKGALSVRAKRITNGMKLAAAYAIAECVVNPSRENIIPSPLDLSVPNKVAKAVAEAWINQK
jgi:malate dehydrogenase (oxaloacetate-decarboxylating)